MIRVRWIAVLVLVAGLTACAGGHGSNATQSVSTAVVATPSIPVVTPPPSATPALSVANTAFLAGWGCSPQLPSTDVSFSDPQGGKSQGTILGDGDTGIVISNQSEGEICAWLPLADALAKKHNRVLLYEYGPGDRSDLVAAAAAFMAAQGAKKVILIGASQGAKATIVAAARNLSNVVALVSLSAEARLAGLDVEPYAEKITLPVLFVTSEQDAYGSDKATQTFFNVAPARDKKLIAVPGTAHGYDLLSDSSVWSAVLKFIEDHQGPPLPTTSTAPPSTAAPSSQPPDRPLDTPPSILASCTLQLSAQAVSVPTPQGGQLKGALIGAGDTAVLISNQSGNSVCDWASFIPQLVDAGFKVLVYKYGTADRVQDAEAAANFLSAQGFKRIILLGGSQGAELTVITAGKNLPGVVAAVSLSADIYLRGVDAGSFAAQVKIPILLISARDDPYGSMDTSTKFYSLAATPSQGKQLVVVPGDAHGYELLADPIIQKQVLAFIQEYR